MTFNRCAAAIMGCVVVVVAVVVMVFIIRAMASDTNNFDTKVDGNDNNIETTNSKEFSLVHIDSIQNLATGQKLTNIVVILGFLIILGIFGFGCFYIKAKKRARRFLKDLERQEVMDKISAIETEMVARGFMKKSKAKKTRKAKKTLTKKTSKKTSQKTRRGRSIEEPGSTEDSD